MAGKYGWQPNKRAPLFPSLPSGNVSLIATIPNAENVTVIPTAPTNFGSSGGSYFAADFPTQIVEYPASDFFGFGGNVLVGSEAAGGPLTMISFTGGIYKASTFQGNAFKGEAEGAAFVQHLRHPFIYAAKFVCGRFLLGGAHPREG